MGVLNYSATTTDNMKFLVLSACVALSTCQLVTHPNGAVVPADTPEVAAAKAAHFGAHGLALPYAGLPYAHAHAGYPYGLVGYANGAVVPVDEPAVLAAKANHAAAGGAVHPVGALGYAYGHLGYAYGYPYAGLVAHPNGAVVPAEPADLVAARAAHLAAHAAA